MTMLVSTENSHESLNLSSRIVFKHIIHCAPTIFTVSTNLAFSNTMNWLKTQFDLNAKTK